jgi:hypothetical protein
MCLLTYQTKDSHFVQWNGAFAGIGVCSGESARTTQLMLSHPDLEMHASATIIARYHSYDCNRHRHLSNKLRSFAYPIWFVVNSIHVFVVPESLS